MVQKTATMLGHSPGGGLGLDGLGGEAGVGGGVHLSDGGLLGCRCCGGRHFRLPGVQSPVSDPFQGFSLEDLSLSPHRQQRALKPVLPRARLAANSVVFHGPLERGDRCTHGCQARSRCPEEIGAEKLESSKEEAAATGPQVQRTLGSRPLAFDRSPACGDGGRNRDPKLFLFLGGCFGTGCDF